MAKVIEVRRAISRGISKKGLNTRSNLMMATRYLMEGKSVRDIRVAEIARRAGTATATFYRYFEDVPAAVAAVAASIEQNTPELARLFTEPWPRAEVLVRSQRFVTIWVHIWELHSPVLRFRNLAADEGDRRFGEARSEATIRVRQALEAKIRELQGNAIDDAALANCLLGLLERTAANLVSRTRLRLSRQRSINGAALVLALTLAGTLPADLVPLEP